MTSINTITAKIHHATKAKAVKLDAILTAEYPVLQLMPLVDAEADKVTGFIVLYCDAEQGVEHTVYEGAKVPELADLFTACEEMDLDPEAIEGEEPQGGSVVPESYRAAYKASATAGQTCGDWLAVWLEGECITVEGFYRVAFGSILQTNAVDQSGKWASLPGSGQKGWVGRWRMNGRQQIEKAMAKNEVLRDAYGTEVKVPKKIMAAMKEKHAAYLNKLAKAAAKAAKQAEAA